MMKVGLNVIVQVGAVEVIVIVSLDQGVRKCWWA